MLVGGVDQAGVALLPVGDLLDHDPQRHVAWHTGPTGTDPFSFISHSPIRKVRHPVFSTPQQQRFWWQETAIVSYRVWWCFMLLPVLTLCFPASKML